ncbi:MAG: BtrH N-terminal domain-containing protein [Chloroflexi bacterium]|nr:BtrH N-terminal domain-containing protein [Chloroflexota bacterium]MCC6894533.1 DUF4872 domain-containing protein [Anaerolineae bacterium]
MTMKFGGIQSTTAALKNALAVQGTTVNEAMLLGIGGGLGAGYILWEFKAHGSAKIVMGFTNRWNYYAERLTLLCQRVGANPVVQEVTGAKAAEKNLNDALSRGKPFLVWVDKAHLPHQHLPESLKGHIPYALGIHGAEGDNICVDDMGAALYAVPRSDFTAARGRIGSDKNRLLLIENPGKIDYEPLIQAGIDEHIEHLSRDSDSFSLPVYKKWAKLLTDTKNKKGWPTVFNTRNGLYATLRSVYEGVVVDGTEGNGLRMLYADFITESADLLGKPALNEAAEAYRKAGQLWRTFGESALSDKVFASTKTLIDQRYEALKHNQSDKVKETVDAVERLNDEFQQEFPLDDAAINRLYDLMQSNLMAVYDAEVAALETLKRVN